MLSSLVAFFSGRILQNCFLALIVARTLSSTWLCTGYILIKVIGLSDFEAAPTSNLRVIPHRNVKIGFQKLGLSCAHDSDAQYLSIYLGAFHTMRM